MRSIPAVMLAVAASVSGTAQAFTWAESFSSATIDPFFWSANTVGDGALALVGGELQMSQSQAGASAALSFNFNVTGDFTLQVEYRLIDWPAANYERVSLSTSFGALERAQHPGWFDEAYVAHFSGLGDGVITTATTDAQGTLRLARTGSTLTGSYWNGSGWTDVRTFSSPGAAADMSFSLAIWNGYADVPIRVAFDNVLLDAPTMTTPAIPEPGTWALCLLGLGVLVGAHAARRNAPR